jgi:predicted nuclease with TOPRIM domain
MLDETHKNLITLEQSLRQTRKDQKELITKREELRGNTNEVLPEVERIKQEINTLEQIAKQTETTIYSIFKTLRLNKS